MRTSGLAGPEFVLCVCAATGPLAKTAASFSDFWIACCRSCLALCPTQSDDLRLSFAYFTVIRVMDQVIVGEKSLRCGVPVGMPTVCD